MCLTHTGLSCTGRDVSDTHRSVMGGMCLTHTGLSCTGRDVSDTHRSVMYREGCV